MSDIKPKVFNFRRHWKTKVIQHLNNKNVKSALDYGMRMIEDSRNIECEELGLGENCWTGMWDKDKKPYLMGVRDYWADKRCPQPYSVNWYRPMCFCWGIAPFCLELGRLIYPKLKWHIIGNRRHTVAVGYKNNQPYMIFDILNYEYMKAEEILDFANRKIRKRDYEKKWNKKERKFVS